jgi:hypothetical protein
MPPDPSRRIPYSNQILSGKLDVVEAIQPIYDEINRKYGLSEKPEAEGECCREHLSDCSR